MAITVEQLQTLNVYVPPPVARLAFQNPHQQPGGTWRRFHAVTVFADISGFTPLAEELAVAGVRGAEELTSILSQVLEALITAAERHGGQVVKFGGDALSLMWPCEPEEIADTILRAVQGTFAMQAAMARFSTVSTRHGEFKLRMKIGISAGEVLEVHAGGVFGRWEYVLAGAPMANMSSAENCAEAGEIVSDELVFSYLSGISTGTPVANENDPERLSSQAEQIVIDRSRVQILNSHETSILFPPNYALGQMVAPGFYRITDLRSRLKPIPLIPPDWSRLKPGAATKVAAILRSYIPGAISSVLESGHKDMLAELKPMTVCFVGFSGIDYNHDPEAGPRLSNFLRDAQEIIYHYEGSVNKLAVGDKGSVLLVLFGAPPFFHEDDEIRAVACALALCKVAARHQLTAQVGLAVGPLFAGPLGAPQRREYTVIGDTVNLAARLMQKASAGEVWVDRSVQSKADRFFEYKDLGDIHVKGKTEPRRVYLALREKEQDQEEIFGYLLSNQELTGRDKELTLIDDLAARVWDGHGQVLLLSGEAGIGKSCLAAEIVRRWREGGGVPYRGDCVSYGRQTPYLPWRSILASIAGLSARLPVEERLTRLEGVLHRLPDHQLVERSEMSSLISSQAVNSTGSYWLERLPLLADILGLETEESQLTRALSEDLRRDNVFATIRAIIFEEARQRPILILLEDTHWGDDLSLDLAVSLATEISDTPIFLVLAHRPLSNPIPGPYQRLQAMPYTTPMPVDELGPEASLKLVQSKLGVKNIPEDLASLILRKGQGNPFFIEELVNSLLGMGALKVENGECQLTDKMDKLEMPDTVQKVVLARIDRLPEAEKVTLKVAAVIGRNFQRDLLEDVHPWFASGVNLNDQLARLQAEDFTRQEVSEGDLDFLFKHVITQEVAYETMLYSQRRELHATIGEALEKRYENNETEVVDMLAYHYVRSYNLEKALYYLQRAGQKALANYNNEAAISYFIEALIIANKTKNTPAQYELLAAREQAYNNLGNREAQTHDLIQMKQIATAQNNPIQLLETGNRRLKLATNIGEYETAITIAEESLALARQHNQAIWEARILMNLGITYWRQSNYKKARQAIQQLLKINNASSEGQLKATGLNYLGLIHAQISEYEQARQNYQEALSIYRAIGDHGGEAGCANNFGLLEASLGRYEQARQRYTEALSICRRIGDRLREGISLNTLGQVHTILGDYQQAQEQLDLSLNIRRAIGDRRGEAFCLHDLGYLYLAAAQANEAGRCFQTACRLRRELGETGNYVASLAARGEAHLALNDLPAADQCLSEAIKHLKEGSGSGEYPPQNVWWLYAQICRARGQDNEADQALLCAYELIKTKADLIRHPEFQRSYLENVQVNAAVMAEMAQVNNEAVS